MCLNNGYRYTIQFGSKQLGQFGSKQLGQFGSKQLGQFGSKQLGQFGSTWKYAPNESCWGPRNPSIVDFLANQFSHSTREEWIQRILRGEVSIGSRVHPNTPASPSHSPEQLLHPGDLIVWDRPPWVEPDTPQEFLYLYEDTELIVVHKPNGLPTLPGGGFYWNTLLYKVQKHHPDAIPLHRLGRATSGIVLFALTKQARRFLTTHWSSFEKVYMALADGLAQQELYEIRTKIGPVPHPKLGSVHAASLQGKEAYSTAKVVRREDDTTLFQVAIHTGRPHQIRIHLASIGHPLLGDPLYQEGGIPKSNLPGLPGDGGYHLHACTLRILHPTTRQPMQWRASPPPYLAD